MVVNLSNNSNNNRSFNAMNKLIEIHQFAIEQMEKWQLIEQNWKFVWGKCLREKGVPKNKI